MSAATAASSPSCAAGLGRHSGWTALADQADELGGVIRLGRCLEVSGAPPAMAVDDRRLLVVTTIGPDRGGADPQHEEVLLLAVPDAVEAEFRHFVPYRLAEVTGSGADPGFLQQLAGGGLGKALAGL